MPIAYDGKKIIPAPFVSIGENYVRNEIGVLGTTFNIVLTGTLVAWMGSPNSSGLFWDLSGYPDDESVDADKRLKAVLKKQEAIRNLFLNPGRSLEIQPLDGSPATKCNPRVIDVQFNEGLWYDRCDYSVTLEADVLYLGATSVSGSFTNKLSDAQETWSIELNEQPESVDLPYTYRMSHTVSAVGKSFYTSEQTLEMPAWKQAKNWVLTRLGSIPTEIALSESGMYLTPSYTTKNQVRSENIDQSAGSYSIQESWILASGTALESFTVSTESNINDGLTRVSIEGRVEGLDVRNATFGLTSTKWDNAQAKFATVSPLLLSRAQTYSAITLNTNPVTQVIGRDPLNGNITYSYEYNNRPSNCISGARMENITITDINPTDVFAAIPVLGRYLGPVLQDISTRTARQRQLSIECIISPSGTTCSNLGSWATRPNVQGIINTVSGELLAVATQVFKDQDQETWNPKTGSYQRQISWTWQ